MRKLIAVIAFALATFALPSVAVGPEGVVQGHPDQIAAYESRDFSGKPCGHFGFGVYGANGVPETFKDCKNDAIRSLRIPKGVEVVLFEDQRDRDGAGEAAVFRWVPRKDNDVNTEGEIKWLPPFIDGKVSYMIVRPAGRASNPKNRRCRMIDVDCTEAGGQKKTCQTLYCPPK